MKQDADTLYPDNRVEGIRAIQRRKTTGNRLIESVTNPSTLISNLRESMRETFLDSEDDNQMYGNKKSSLTNFDGTEYMTLPVLYNSPLKNPNELSTDIFSDLLVYKYAANTFNEMDKIVDPLEVARNLVVDKERNVMETRGGA